MTRRLLGWLWARLRPRPGPLLVLRVVAAVVLVRRLVTAARRRPPLAVSVTAPDLPSISVVIPARDEERRLGPLLEALRGAPAVGEVVVVDDGSTDGTAALARSLGARVVAGAPLPDGWAGKAWALQEGLESATGTWVVTLDADARPSPDLPRALVQRAIAERWDLVTVAGRFECPTPGMAVLHPAMLTTLVYRFGAVDPLADPPAHRAMANGQCMAAQRTGLLGAGGLALVAGEVVEDVALARRLAGDGWRVAMVDGSDLLTVRMYEDAADAWSGWSRSLALPGVEPRARQVADLAVLTATQAAPVLRLAVGRADLLDVVLLAARAGTLAGTATAYADRRSTYWLSPVADPLAVAAVARGVLAELRGRPRQWRGRTYPGARPAAVPPSGTAAR
jgi:dolichol-phosphate mannosyltransferase